MREYFMIHPYFDERCDVSVMRDAITNNKINVTF